jgi:hypothetical protein
MTEKRSKVGRPPKNDPNEVEAVQKKIDAYFDECKEEEQPATFCGLALALDYCDRSTLWRTATAGTPISQPIKKAMLRIEEQYERTLHGSAPTGSIFALKNRGWTDKQEIEHSGQEPILIKVVKGAGD